VTLIDLSTPAPVPAGILDALPRRVALTLPELQHVAAAAGGAPLPFEVRTPGDPASDLDDRLGRSRTATDASAYADALASLHEPASSLGRRGLVDPAGVVDAGLAGAVGLLASPAVAVDLEVVAEGVRARAWHRQAGDAVATLATVDGLVFELAWFPAVQWPIELARIAALPEDVVLRDSAVPDLVELPYELADAAAEAVAADRGDLLPVLAAQHDHGRVATTTGAVLRGLAVEARGRLRAMVADATLDPATTVGVVSWTLLADGWHALRVRRGSDGDRVEVRRVAASDLAADLAPVLAEVTG
jgi:hypothetical protein